MWKELDGFDKALRPAYYEDTDLCFRIHEKGLKIVNVFESRVMHFETVSYGDKEMNQSEISQKNGRYFYRKWARALNDEQHKFFVANLLKQMSDYLRYEKRHQLCYKEKMQNGRRHIYVMGLKILSYKRKK